MFLYLGGNTVVRSSEIIGIFDIEECSVSRVTAEYLNSCQKNGKIVNVSDNMPKSFIVTEKNTFISNVSHDTINMRGRKIKATPHKDCRSIAQSDFSSD